MQQTATAGTSIRLSVEVWRRLTMLKARPSETFDDLIRRLLDEREQAGRGAAEKAAS